MTPSSVSLATLGITMLLVLAAASPEERLAELAVARAQLMAVLEQTDAVRVAGSDIDRAVHALVSAERLVKDGGNSPIALRQIAITRVYTERAQRALMVQRRIVAKTQRMATAQAPHQGNPHLRGRPDRGSPDQRVDRTSTTFASL